MPNHNRPHPQIKPHTMPNQPVQNLLIENLQNISPDLLEKIKPPIEQIAQQLKGENISDQLIDSIIQEILRSSGLDTKDEPEDMTTMAPLSQNTGYGYPQPYPPYPYPPYPFPYPSPYPSPFPNPKPNYNKYPKPGYPGFSLKNLLRLMLFQQLGKYYLD